MRNVIEVTAVVSSYVGWTAFTLESLILLEEVSAIFILIMSIDQ